MATAKLNPDYALRMCGVGALLCALAAWSIYDGAVAWPRANRNLAEVRPVLLATCESGNATPEYWLSPINDDSGMFPLKADFEEAGFPLPRTLVQELREITRPEGDSPAARHVRCEAAAELFSRDLYPQGKCRGQFVQAAVLLVLAFLSFAAVARKRNVVFNASKDGLSGSGFGNDRFSWDQVEDVDWSRWNTKGILAVVVGGKRFTLDGWHFKGMRDIARQFEEKGWTLNRNSTAGGTAK